MDESLGPFIDDLIQRKFRSEDLVPTIIDELRLDLACRIEDHINAAILDRIHESEIAEFNEILDSEDDLKVQQFVAKRIPHLDVLITQVLSSFKKAYLGAGITEPG
jgi:hypothetical protein